MNHGNIPAANEYFTKTFQELEKQRPTTPASAVQPAVGDEIIPVGCHVVADANDRGRLFSLRLMGPHYTGRGEALCQNLEPDFAKKLAALINGAAAHTQHTTAVEAEVARLRDALHKIKNLRRYPETSAIAQDALASRKDNVRA